MKTTTRTKSFEQLWRQYDRIWRRLIERTKLLAKRAHPETNGEDLFVHNWGNEASKAVWAAFWARWRKIDPIYEALCQAAEHRRHGPDFRPTWCEFCQASKPGKRRPSCRGVQAGK